MMEEQKKIHPDNMELEDTCKAKKLWSLPLGMHLKQVLFQEEVQQTSLYQLRVITVFAV